ncbi:MAG: AI-2E family transporter [Pseudomonadota bacterium]|nr:AI-2E family transporter [Pseudomonadota bacterium]
MRTLNSPDATFTALVIAVSIAFIYLLLPFYSALLWAVVLAVLFLPLNRWLVRRLGGRRNTAAALTVLACACLVVIPGSLLLGILAQDANNFYQRISSGEFDPAATLERVGAALPQWLVNLFPMLDFGDFEALKERLRSGLSQISGFVAGRALNIGQGTARFFIGLGVMLYVLFFLFRDGTRLVGAIRDASPLSEHRTVQMMKKFGEVVRATVKGNFIIALLQGGVGGVAFWALGIEAALLWGVVMVVLSLLPAVGAFLVWVPVTVYLFMSGAVAKGLILLLIGALVISLIDNLLRPRLVGKDIGLPDYLVLVSTLGGLALFGMNGFVIGPLIAALFVTVWSPLAGPGRGPGKPPVT